MARDKQVPTFHVDASDLPDLTPQQAAFVHHLLSGMTASDAYRSAYNTQNYADSSVWVDASRLRSHPNVSLWLTAARQNGLERYSEDWATEKRRHLERMAELRTKAEASGNYGAAVKAEENIGKVLGLYVERVEVEQKQGSGQDLLTEVETVFGADAARKAAIKLGLPDPNPEQPLVIEGEATRLQ